MRLLQSSLTPRLREEHPAAEIPGGREWLSSKGPLPERWALFEPSHKVKGDHGWLVEMGRLMGRVEWRLELRPEQ